MIARERPFRGFRKQRGSRLAWDVSKEGDMAVKSQKFTLHDVQAVLADGPLICLSSAELQRARSAFWESRKTGGVHPET